MNTDALLADKIAVALDLVTEAQETPDVLRVLARLAETVESATRTAVQAEREAGAPWARIAQQLDVSTQAAHKRFRQVG